MRQRPRWAVHLWEWPSGSLSLTRTNVLIVRWTCGYLTGGTTRPNASTATRRDLTG